ncbi:hypothetical protein ACI797_25595 [Geodermatophilus sp. SYSU D00691]
MTTLARGAVRAGRAVTVELAGIPGSGKSRRARALAGLLTDRGVTVHQPQVRLGPAVPTLPRLARKAGACAAAALAAPGTTAGVARAVVASGQPGTGDVAARLVQWLVAERTTARAARRGGVGLVDEGEVQALWSTGLRGAVDPVLAALDAAGHRGAADLLVVVDVPAEVALARLTARRSRHSRVQALGERDALAELQRGIRLLHRLTRWWAGGGGQVVTLDGTVDDDPGLVELADRLSS